MTPSESSPRRSSGRTPTSERNSTSSRARCRCSPESSRTRTGASRSSLSRSRRSSPGPRPTERSRPRPRVPLRVARPPPPRAERSSPCRPRGRPRPRRRRRAAASRRTVRAGDRTTSAAVTTSRAAGLRGSRRAARLRRRPHWAGECWSAQKKAGGDRSHDKPSEPTRERRFPAAHLKKGLFHRAPGGRRPWSSSTMSSTSFRARRGQGSARRLARRGTPGSSPHRKKGTSPNGKHQAAKKRAGQGARSVRSATAPS